MQYPNPPYHNRTHAGEVLAHHLNAYAHRADTLVLGLARGGLPVAQAIGRELGLPVDILVVRKLGVPGREELAFGAIAAGVRVFVAGSPPPHRASRRESHRRP